MNEDKEQLLELSKKLELRHTEIKSEMLKIFDASKILAEQYDELEKKLYQVEEEYVGIIKQLAKK